MPTVPQSGPLAGVATALQDQYGPIEATRDLTTVGPVISSELTQQAIILVLLGSLGIMIWMTFRFRNLKFGVTALIALLHDVIVVIGRLRHPRHVLRHRDRRACSSPRC